MPRPRVTVLSPERIADAGLELVDSGEPFGVNAIARRLGVRPSSLYNHVDGRDGIVELMRGRLVSRYAVHPEAGESWDAFLLRLMRAHRRMYADHPLLVPLLVGKTITHPAVIGAYDEMATALAGAGFPDGEILTIVTLIDAFAIGFGFDLASPADVWKPDGPTRTLGRVLAEESDRDARAERAFDLAAQVLLDSLRARLAA
ncbi:TetR/AcrR family transcriptional regulator [Microbacterium sp. JZ31]|uniref:TetR/AcrR family transcriptional regulator n=1 Tax=Microbacterium sp. JZ31 TaxID=1906274 RepID=UPI0019335297|nr:TetR/AcrR family transcriptional regulator C-terminal domain-containing protein [Microbacterium sp. JZ31]